MNTPLTLEITSIAAGWIDAQLKLKDKTVEFPISIQLSQGIFHLLGVLYYCSPEHKDSNNSEMEHFIKEWAYLDDGSEWAWKAEVDWCAEPQVMTWYIEREITDKPDFNLHIRIESNINQEEVKTIFDENIDFKPFCYSLVKTIDDAFKRYGFMGTDEGVFHDREFILAHFLYMKAYVLDRLDLVEIKYQESRVEPISSFEKEIELLKLPM